MADLLKQSSTAQPLMFLMIDSSDHVSAKTGLSPTVTLCKSGASFASPAGSVTEVSNGWYKVAGNATDTNTLGPLVLHATGSGADPSDVSYTVVAFDPQVATNLGLSALPTASPGAANGMFIAGTNAATTITTALTSNIIGNVTGALSGAVGSVTGNVGGVTGVTFPASVASPTNITAGTITTVTNLTNSASAGDFTSTMKTSLNSATPAVTVSDKTGFSLSTAGVKAIWDQLTAALTTTASIGKKLTDWVLGTDSKSLLSTDAQTGVVLPRVTLTDTVTTYTGNTVQTGDSYSRIGATGSGLTSLASATNMLEANDDLDEIITTLASGFTLSSSERNSIADALLDRTSGVETSVTPRQFYRLTMAVLSGISVDTSGVVTFKRADGTTTALTVTHDTVGNRSASTIGTL